MERPVEDEEPINVGIFGKTMLLDDRYQIGGVSLIDALNQTVGKTYGAQCPKTFGGTSMPAVAYRWRTRTPSPAHLRTCGERVRYFATPGAPNPRHLRRRDDRLHHRRQCRIEVIEVKQYAADGTITTLSLSTTCRPSVMLTLWSGMPQAPD